MVISNSNQIVEARNQSPANSAKLQSRRSPWGTPKISGGQSSSTTGSAGGSPSATPPSDNTFVRMNQLDIHGDDAGSSQVAVSGKKKKRGTRAAAGDKSGRGLRQFSMKVCEKVESKGRTTYNEVADELVAEFSDPGNNIQTPDQQQYDEKNIRRRVYDALNVLMAMDTISKDKKEIQWKGLPRTSVNDIEELKAERVALKSRIEKKAAYLQELEDQYIGLQNLVHRNEQLYGNNPPGGVALPFILVQTRPHATVEVEISEDMQLVHFDFNSTPFELHDDSYVLKAMRFCGREQQNGGVAHESMFSGGESSSLQASMLPPQMPQHDPMRPCSSAMVSSSPQIPGILKARSVLKNEH